MVEQLLNLCVEIYAFMELDWEITLAGNGTNSSEASNVADEILNIIGKPENFSELVNKKIDELDPSFNEQ